MFHCRNLLFVLTVVSVSPFDSAESGYSTNASVLLAQVFVVVAQAMPCLATSRLFIGSIMLLVKSIVPLCFLCALLFILHRIPSCNLPQAELLERKAFLSDSKQVLLGATDSLDGQKTRDKMAKDDRLVSYSVNEACSHRALLDSLGIVFQVPGAINRSIKYYISNLVRFQRGNMYTKK